MKTTTKIGVGLSIAAIASISVAVLASEKLASKFSSASNRYKAKRFVHDKLGGNQRVLHVLDGLSDNELDTVMDVLKKAKDGREKLNEYGEMVKEESNSVKDRLLKFIEDLL